MEKTTVYRRPMGESLFEEDFTVEALSEMGNPLERLSNLVEGENSEKTGLSELLPLGFMDL